MNAISCNLLFVYGTLRHGSGHHMADFLAERSRSLGEARVRGQLFDLGRFPGMLAPSAPDDWVLGDLLELHDAQQTLSELDRYEDEEGIFPRRLTKAYDLGGREVECWVYFYAGSMAQATRIPSGDYLMHQRRAK